MYGTFCVISKNFSVSITDLILHYLFTETLAIFGSPAGATLEMLTSTLTPSAGNFCRSLSGFTQPIRQNEYQFSVTGVLHIEPGLKIRVYVLR